MPVVTWYIRKMLLTVRCNISAKGRWTRGGSITSGLTNVVGNAIYGTKPLKSVGDAFLRGAATAGINYISDLIGQKPGWEGIDAGLLTGMAGKLISPYGGALRNPRRGCGSASPFVSGLGYGSSKGYKYDVPKAGSAGRKEKKKFSLKEFLKETAVGGITGGVASAGFYGAGKGIEALRNNVRNIDIDSALSLKYMSGDEKQRAALDAAMKIAGPSTDKEFKVFGHGNPKIIMSDKGPLDAEKLAVDILNSPEYIGGKQKVILYACRTGKEPDGLAQQLSNILGVVVEAPTTEIWLQKSGEFFIGDITKVGKKYYVHMGEMMGFKPKI